MKKLFLALVLVSLFATPGLMRAAQIPGQSSQQTFCQGGKCTYVALEPLPLLPDCYGPTPPQTCIKSVTEQFTGEWITKGFNILIGAGALAAVVMIVLGALTYMFSDVVGNKTKAIARIRNAMWGLVILVSSYLILYTINPELTSFNLNFQLLNNYNKSPSAIPPPTTPPANKAPSGQARVVGSTLTISEGSGMGLQAQYDAYKTWCTNRGGAVEAYNGAGNYTCK